MFSIAFLLLAVDGVCHSKNIGLIILKVSLFCGLLVTSIYKWLLNIVDYKDTSHIFSRAEVPTLQSRGRNLHYESIDMVQSILCWSAIVTNDNADIHFVFPFTKFCSAQTLEHQMHSNRICNKRSWVTSINATAAPFYGFSAVTVLVPSWAFASKMACGRSFGILFPQWLYYLFKQVYIFLSTFEWSILPLFRIFCLLLAGLGHSEIWPRQLQIWGLKVQIL
jgi:hypothetical protein